MAPAVNPTRGCSALCCIRFLCSEPSAASYTAGRQSRRAGPARRPDRGWTRLAPALPDASRSLNAVGGQGPAALGGLTSPCSVRPGKMVLNPLLPTVTAPALLLCPRLSHTRGLAPPDPALYRWLRGLRKLRSSVCGSRDLVGSSCLASVGCGGWCLCTGVPGAHILLSLCSKKCACAVPAGCLSGCLVLKRPLSDTPLKLRELLCAPISPEVRAGLDEMLLYSVVASSLIICPGPPQAGAGRDPAKKGTYSAVHTCTILSAAPQGLR